ncbi:MAG: alkaline phosphatase family protein [Armatimonadota bacterium]|nr:alkaline phosphatase family protein [Armatimonadota bacterium]
MRKRILYVIIDGLGDRPLPELDGRTPLEAARTPHLDQLAQQGRQGLVTTVGPGIAPESDVAVMAVLGYDPHRYHTGRGPLEALGVGIRMREGDLALRGNFATVDDGWILRDRRAGRDLTSAEAHALAEAVCAQVQLTEAPVTFDFRATIGHRCVLVLFPREGRLSANITNTDPAYERLGGLGVARAGESNEVERARPLDESEEARIAAALVNEFTWRSREVLEHHPINERRRKEGRLPANVILLRDAGDRLPEAPSFQEVFGRSFACFVEMPVERGIASLLGMTVIEVPPVPGGRPEAYRRWAEMALDAIQNYEGIYLHLKGPDEPGHDGDFRRKKEMIEEIDRAFFGTLLPSLDLQQVLIAVTADHATPCSLRGHSDDPVPLLVSGGGISADGTRSFGEREASNGSLGHLKGIDILPLLLQLAS